LGSAVAIGIRLRPLGTASTCRAVARLSRTFSGRAFRAAGECGWADDAGRPVACASRASTAGVPAIAARNEVGTGDRRGRLQYRAAPAPVGCRMLRRERLGVVGLAQLRGDRLWQHRPRKVGHERARLAGPRGKYGVAAAELRRSGGCQSGRSGPSVNPRQHTDRAGGDDAGPRKGTKR